MNNTHSRRRSFAFWLTVSWEETGDDATTNIYCMRYMRLVYVRYTFETLRIFT